MTDMGQSLDAESSTQNIKNKIHSIIAVASGKGGVGKSTVSMLLAHFLKKRGYRVGMLDADIYGPSLALMTKASPPSQQGNTIFPGKSDDISIISVGMFADPNKAQVLRGPMAANLLGQLYRQVAWGELDFLIIDYPPGTGDIQLSLSQLLTVNAALLVTTPQDLALLDVRKAISMFKTLNVPLAGIVENMSYFVCSKCQEKHFLLGQGGGAKLAKEFALPELGSLPVSQGLTMAGDKGLFGDDSSFTSELMGAIESIGSSFLTELEKIRPAPTLVLYSQLEKLVSQEPLAIKEIWQKNSITLGIKWSDSQEYLYDVRTLRALCPCAGCQAQKFSPELLEQVRPKTITSVGSYALKIDFTDGHNTGIYSFEFLKDLGEQQQKKG